jgi:hypothetical protein
MFLSRHAGASGHPRWSDLLSDGNRTFAEREDRRFVHAWLPHCGESRRQLRRTRQRPVDHVGGILEPINGDE